MYRNLTIMLLDFSMSNKNETASRDKINTRKENAFDPESWPETLRDFFM